MASAFLDEYEEAMGSLDGGGKQLRSQRLLCHMKRLKCTKKESNVSLLEREGLQADCKISNIEVGLKNLTQFLQFPTCWEP